MRFFQVAGLFLAVVVLCGSARAAWPPQWPLTLEFAEPSDFGTVTVEPDGSGGWITNLPEYRQLFLSYDDRNDAVKMELFEYAPDFSYSVGNWTGYVAATEFPGGTWYDITEGGSFFGFTGPTVPEVAGILPAGFLLPLLRARSRQSLTASA